jgi:hypothetical protein
VSNSRCKKSSGKTGCIFQFSMSFIYNILLIRINYLTNLIISQFFFTLWIFSKYLRLHLWPQNRSRRSGYGRDLLVIQFVFSKHKKVWDIVPTLLLFFKIFREAKIQDAIIFFDECETLFMSRDKGAHHVNTFL